MNKVLINGFEDTTIDVRDRGFQYGDGLFETIAYKNNILEYWDQHMQRIRSGCERLSLPYVDESLWLDDIEKCQLSVDSVVKLIVSRGVSGRGYVYTGDNNVTRVTSSFNYPKYTIKNQQGIAVITCKTPVSMNTALAGIKHLNRLDNVLARNEWSGNDIAEGFMFDNQQNIIEGTMSNVFCFLGDQLYTPSIKQCGVAGVMREQVIEIAHAQGIPVNIVNISKQNLLQMDAVFITNSLIGIWPVKSIDDIAFEKNELLTKLQEALNRKVL